jgi:RNA polymerase sigma-70 factor (ECF subfamily)
VNRLRPRLTKMAWFYARRTHEDADDLLQEAWIGMLEALRELDMSIGDPEQYLICRARWRLLDAIKYARIRRHESLSEGCGDETICDEAEEGAPSHVNEQHIDHILASLCIAEFATHLKPVQRTILHCLMRGLTWRETGSVLGCTSANVAYHVRQIARAYEAWNEEPVARLTA